MVEETLTPADEYRKMNVVRVQEDGDTYWDVSRPPLSNEELLKTLTAEQKEDVYANGGLSRYRVERDETPVDDRSEVKKMTPKIRKYKARAAASEQARKTLIVQRLLDGESPESCQADAGVNYSVMKSWFHYKDANDKLVPLDKDILAEIVKAEKAAKKSKT